MVQSEEVRLQAAAEDGQGGSSSYGDGEIVPPLGSEGGEALQSGHAKDRCKKFGRLKTRRAAAFWMSCSGWMTQAGRLASKELQ